MGFSHPLTPTEPHTGLSAPSTCPSSRGPMSEMAQGPPGFPWSPGYPLTPVHQLHYSPDLWSTAPGSAPPCLPRAPLHLSIEPQCPLAVQGHLVKAKPDPIPYLPGTRHGSQTAGKPNVPVPPGEKQSFGRLVSLPAEGHLTESAGNSTWSVLVNTEKGNQEKPLPDEPFLYSNRSRSLPSSSAGPGSTPQPHLVLWPPLSAPGISPDPGSTSGLRTSAGTIQKPLTPGLLPRPPWAPLQTLVPTAHSPLGFPDTLWRSQLHPHLPPCLEHELLFV